MNRTYLKIAGVVFVFAFTLSLQAHAQEEGTPLAYPHFQITTRTPSADRPDNSVTAMPSKAREQFDHDEEKNRQRLEENHDRQNDSDEHQHHHDTPDGRDDSRDHNRHDSDRLHVNPGGFVPQLPTGIGDDKTIRHHENHSRSNFFHHRHTRIRRYYHYNFRRHIYVYDPVTVVHYVPAVVVPDGYDSLSYGGITYYYNDGRFYVPSSGQVVEVQPPVGAVVPQLPKDPVIINDGEETYYVDDGVFYRKVRNGYKVIAPPFGPRVSDGVLTAGGDDREDIYIHLPDSEGGYVDVTLSRTGQGFKGPQDEYYPEFPPIDQLQEMYGSDD